MNNQNQAIALRSIQLEKVKLATFRNTSVQEFFEWRSAFDSLVHTQPLADARKIIELFNYISEAAQTPIKGFARVGANYQACYDAVVKRYGNEVALKNELIATLKRLRLKKEGDVIAFTDAFNGILRTYRACGRDPNDLSSWLVQHAVCNLDADLEVKWSERELTIAHMYQREAQTTDVEAFLNLQTDIALKRQQNRLSRFERVKNDRVDI